MNKNRTLCVHYNIISCKLSGMDVYSEGKPVMGESKAKGLLRVGLTFLWS